jgi:hypothetical protein
MNPIAARSRQSGTLRAVRPLPIESKRLANRALKFLVSAPAKRVPCEGRDNRALRGTHVLLGETPSGEPTGVVADAGAYPGYGKSVWTIHLAVPEGSD